MNLYYSMADLLRSVMQASGSAFNATGGTAKGNEYSWNRWLHVIGNCTGWQEIGLTGISRDDEAA